MIDQDKQKFANLLTGLAEYYKSPMSSPIMRLYWDSLKSYNYEAVEMAFSRHIGNPDTGQFMPKVADVTRMLQGTTTDSSLVAWSKVDRAVRDVGVYETVVFDDPLIHVVLMEMGGWVPLGSKDEGEWPFVAKEFQTRYRGYKSRNEIPKFTKALIGIAESHNTQQGFEIRKPILIGNKELAERVFSSGSNDHRMGLTRMQESSQILIH